METLAELLLTLVALSGELPASQICRLPSTPGYQAKILKSLKKDGLLLSYYRNGLRGLRLTSAAKKRLLAEHYDWFLPYLSGVTETNRLKSDITRRLRLHRMAEVLVTMLNAGVSVLPWEKPDVFTSTPPDDPLTVDRPTYYSSREVKELGELAVKIRGSRSTGVLLGDGGIFIVYNTGPGQMKWEYTSRARRITASPSPPAWKTTRRAGCWFRPSKKSEKAVELLCSFSYKTISRNERRFSL